MMKFDLIIPVYNEVDYIQNSLSVVSSFLFKMSAFIDWDIVVVDNASTDKTKQVVQMYADQNLNNFQLNYLFIKQKGKGRAIKVGARKSKADIFGFIDVDLAADPGYMDLMLKMVLDNDADLVIASRLLNTKTTDRSWWRNLSSRIFNKIVNLFLKLDIRDTQCGLKIMNKRAKNVLLKCEENDWFLDIEFLARAKKEGLKIKEVSVPWVENRYQNRKSKIKYFKDSLEGLLAILRIKKRLKYA